eukprot:6119851-Pleurochrysis_carterae.AAC.1
MPDEPRLQDLRTNQALLVRKNLCRLSEKKTSQCFTIGSKDPIENIETVVSRKDMFIETPASKGKREEIDRVELVFDESERGGIEGYCKFKTPKARQRAASDSQSRRSKAVRGPSRSLRPTLKDHARLTRSYFSESLRDLLELLPSERAGNDEFM